MAASYNFHLFCFVLFFLFAFSLHLVFGVFVQIQLIVISLNHSKITNKMTERLECRECVYVSSTHTYEHIYHVYAYKFLQ